MKTMVGDGNLAAAQVAYALSETAAVYPITPSTPMAENCDEWAHMGKRNVFGQKMRLTEMQSEGGAAGALHASLSGYLSYQSFTYNQSTIYLIMIMIGGTVSPVGAVIGTCVITILQEGFRALQDYMQLIYGVGVIVLMIFARVLAVRS